MIEEGFTVEQLQELKLKKNIESLKDGSKFIAIHNFISESPQGQELLSVFHSGFSYEPRFIKYNIFYIKKLKELQEKHRSDPPTNKHLSFRTMKYD